MMSPKAYALMKVESQWLNPKREFDCLHQLWTKESNWRPNAHNKSSGAFGIAQFLPSTWANYKYPYKPKDPQIQIKAGLRYIYKRYGTPCKAWEFWKRQAGPDLHGGWY
jgi:muramidase (phage lysozyme)